MDIDFRAPSRCLAGASPCLVVFTQITSTSQLEFVELSQFGLDAKLWSQLKLVTKNNFLEKPCLLKSADALPGLELVGCYKFSFAVIPWGPASRFNASDNMVIIPSFLLKITFTTLVFSQHQLLGLYQR